MPSIPTIPDVQRSLEAAAANLAAANSHNDNLPLQANIIAAAQAHATLAQAQMDYFKMLTRPAR
jgi:hypothetical protein